MSGAHGYLPSILLGVSQVLATASAGSPALAEPTSGTPTITSTAELQRYLQDTPLQVSPLGQLSEGGRREFLSALRFNRGGVSGYSYGPLIMELDVAQVRAVNALFGLSAEHADMIAGMVDIRPAARAVRQNAIRAGNACHAPHPCPDIARDAKRFLQRRTQPFADAARGATHVQDRTMLRRDFQRWLSPHLASTPLSELDAVELELLHQATGHACAVLMDAECARQLERLTRALDAKALAARRHYVGLYRAHIAARQFDAARVLHDTRPDDNLPAVPRTRTIRVPAPGQSSAWHVLDDGGGIERRVVDLGQGIQIVVSASPHHCSFSNAAMRAIETDPALSAAMAGAIWLAPQDGTLDTRRISQWNRDHPGMPIRIAHLASEWPELDLSRTPVFHVFVDGRLQTVVTGWTEDESRAELVRALRAVGRLPAPERDTTRTPTPDDTPG